MKTRVSLILATVALLAACARIQIDGPSRDDQMHESLRTVVSGAAPAYVKPDPEGPRLWRQTRTFYEEREYRPAWVENAKARPQMASLIHALREADREGLDPELYNVSMLEQRHAEARKGFLSEKGFDPREAGALDVWLTYLYMKYASDLADGLSDLARADKTWQIATEKFDARAHLEKALSENRVRESLSDLLPRSSEYERLRSLLADYRTLQANGGWPTVPAMRLKPGQRSPHLAVLAARLKASGDYHGGVPETGPPSPYSEELQEAVKAFQRRHGLADDAVVGPQVVAALNVPLARRIEQVTLNLERWRWLPRDLGERYILVNVPEMQLDVYEGGRVPLSMRVVVGKADTPTPIFNDRMTYLVFSPYWNVPPSIAEGETLPSLMNDPAFLSRNNMEIVDKEGNVLDPASIDLADRETYRFRQRPGGTNSLGLVKFMFPNQFNVYLHDTPADSLFERATRSFSHGCVRLQDPVALAQYVLRDQPEWTRERIIEAMHAGTEQSVTLKDAIPVYLGYFTARVRPDGAAHFLGDVYKIDNRQQVRLADRLERLRRTGEAAAAATTVSREDAKTGSGKKGSAKTGGEKGKKDGPRKP